MSTSPKIYLVDDEPALLKALTRLLKAEGFDVASFVSATRFLEHPRPTGCGCLVLDEAMPGMTGSELQSRLNAEGCDLSIVFITGKGDIPMSVRAIKAGAVDFLTKPVKDSELLSVIRQGLDKSEARVAERASVTLLREKHDRLTARERDVLRLAVQGLPNKQIASDLGIVEQTVKVHRSRVMSKMGAESFAQLVLFTEKLRTFFPQ